MTKHKFRPFWSYDVLKTQAWLEALSLKGFRLTNVQFNRRVFVFDSTTPHRRTYFLGYDKHSKGELEHIIEHTTYQTVCFNRHYFVLSNETVAPSYDVSHDGIIEKNERLKTITGLVLLYYFCMGIVPLLLLGSLIVFSNRFEITFIEETAFDIASLNVFQLGVFVLGWMIGLSVTLWIIYTYFKLKASNQRLRLTSSKIPFAQLNKQGLLTQTNPDLKQSKQRIKKIRLAWQYAPDRLETWIEQMETKGYNLIGVNKLGNLFSFVIGPSRRVKVHVDYQDTRNPEYFTINQESGWQLRFTTSSKRFAYSIWLQPYDTVEPKFYSDRATVLRHARKHVLHHGIVFIPIVIGYFVIILSQLITSFTSPSRLETIQIINLVIFTVVLFEFSYFAMKAFAYYRRVKKSYYP